MSEPVYRIEVEHDPHGHTDARWYLRVFALADDGYPVHTGYYASKEEAVVSASTWIKIEKERADETLIVYADEDGRAASPPEQHSVRA